MRMQLEQPFDGAAVIALAPGATRHFGCQIEM